MRVESDMFDALLPLSGRREAREVALLVDSRAHIPPFYILIAIGDQRSTPDSLAIGLTRLRPPEEHP